MGDAMKYNAAKSTSNDSTKTNTFSKKLFLIIGGLLPVKSARKDPADDKQWIILGDIAANSFYRIRLQEIGKFFIYPSLGGKGEGIMNKFFILREQFISGPTRRRSEDIPPILELP
jgi:hypothetical protein